MSIKIQPVDYEVIEIAILSLERHDVARQLDALLTIHASLESASSNLQSLLINLSERKSELKTSQMRLATAYVWTLLDGLDRAFTIAQNMDTLTCKKDTADSMLPLSKIRNSFHHLEDRIKHFFAHNQGSVFGDLFWRYRPTSNEKEVGVLFLTSPVFGNPNPEFDKGILNAPNSEVAHEVGVYDLRIFYLEGKPKNDYHKPVEFSVDKGVQVINELMAFIEAYHKHGIERYKQTMPNKQLPHLRMPSSLLMMFDGGNNPRTTTTDIQNISIEAV